MNSNSPINQLTIDQTVIPILSNYDSDIEIVKSDEEPRGTPANSQEVIKDEVDSPFEEDEKRTVDSKTNETINEILAVEDNKSAKESLADRTQENLSMDHSIQQSDHDEEFETDPEGEETDDDEYTDKAKSAKKIKRANYSCKYCPSKYNSCGSLWAHNQRNHKRLFTLDKKFKRINKTNNTALRKTFLKNRKIIHGVQRDSSYGTEFPCDHCAFSYVKFNSWWQHVKQHHNGKGICTEKQRIEELKRRNSEDSDETANRASSEEPTTSGKENDIYNLPEYFACPYCPRVYEQYNSAHAHLTNQHPNRIRPNMEKLRKTGNKTSTSRMEKTTKNEKKQDVASPSFTSLKCDKCPKTFATIDFLNKHKASHIKPLESPSSVFCDECGQIFKGVVYLGIHKRSKCSSSSNESPSLSGTPNRTSAFQRTQNVASKLDNSESNENLFTPPSNKQFCRENIRPQRSVGYSRTKDFANAERLSSSVKQERKTDEYENSSTPSVPNTIVKDEPVEVSTVESSSVNCRPARDSTLSVWKGLKKMSNEENERIAQKRPSIATKHSDYEDCLVVDGPKNKKQKTSHDANSSVMSDFTNVSDRNSINSTINSSFPSDPIEKSRLPLSAAIFTRSAQFPKELMIIWSSSLEEDLLAAVSLNTANSVLCVQELQILKLNEQHKAILEKSNMVNFSIFTSADTTSQWTVISFEQNLNSLKNKLFKNFMDVERAFSEHAATRGMMLNNVMRYSKYEDNDVQVGLKLRAPTSQEVESLTSDINTSLSDRKLRKYMNINDIQMFYNANVLEKSADMKNNVLDACDIAETLGFILIGSNEKKLSNIINAGLSINDLLSSDHGVSTQSFSVSRHIDQVTPAPLFANLKMKIMRFKISREKCLPAKPVSSVINASNHLLTSNSVAGADDQSLSQLELFRSSADHFKLDEAGDSVQTPSSVRLYAVCTVSYNGKKISAGSPSRLKPYYQLLKNASVTPSSGFFAGSSCRFSSLSSNATRLPILELFSLHIREEFYQHKDILKLPQFQSLLEANNWGKLLREIEFEIGVGISNKTFVSYWGFTSDLPNFPKTLSTIKSKNLVLIGPCGKTLVFLIPNGQLASLLGLPFVNCPILHGIAINAEVSALGIPSNNPAADVYERSVIAAESSHISRNLFEMRQSRRKAAAPKIKTVKSVRWADDIGKDLIAHQEIPNRRSADYMKENSIVVDSSILRREWPTGFNDEGMNFQSQEQQLLARFHDARRITHDVQQIGHESLYLNGRPAMDGRVDHGWMPNLNSTNTSLDVPKLEDTIGGSLCIKVSVDSPANVHDSTSERDDHFLTAARCSNSDESIAGMPISPFNDVNVQNSPPGCSMQEVDLLEHDVELTFHGNIFYDPIMKSVRNYMHSVKTEAEIYNGCLTMGYTEKGHRRTPLLTTPIGDKMAVFGSTRKRQLAPTLPSDKVQIVKAIYDKLMAKKTVEVPVEKKPVVPNQLLIVMDSDILYNELMKPSEFGMMLRRLKLDKQLTLAPHQLLYHEYVDRSIRESLQNSGTSLDKKECLEDYLLLLESYKQQKMVATMEPHGCDRLAEQNHVRCLRYTISTARKDNNLINIAYLTDLNRCSIVDSFEDKRIRFVDYKSWIDIFDKAT